MSAPTGPSGYREVLRQRDFVIIWSGRIVSSLGDALRNVSLIWLVRQLTGSTLAMGTVMLCATLPYLVFGLFAGSLVDLADRKKIMIWSDIVRGVLSLAVPLLLWAGALRLWQLCLVAVISSFFSTFFGPAMMASIPSIVGKEGLLGANALTSFSTQLSGIIGPALGGVMVGLWGTGPAFILDGVSFFVSAGAIYLARIPGAKPTQGGAQVNVGVVLRGVRDGFSFLRHTPLLTSVVGVAVGFNFILAPLGILLATHVDDVWHAGARGFGLLGSVESGGMAVGTLLVGLVAGRLRREAMVPLALAVMGLSVGGLAFGTNLGHGLVAVAVMGLMGPMANVPLLTWLMEITPDRIRGRVFSATDVSCQLATPISLAAVGYATDVLGTRALFGLIMVVSVIGAAVLAVVFRRPGERPPRGVAQSETLLSAPGQGSGPKPASNGRDHDPGTPQDERNHGRTSHGLGPDAPSAGRMPSQTGEAESQPG